jgi:hypothetical protein
MKPFLLLLVVNLLLFGSAVAQVEYETRIAIEFFNSSKTNGSNWRNELNEKHIEGSPFLNENFTEGSVFTSSKTEFVDVPLRYNIYNHQIEFKSDDEQVLALAVPEVIEKVEMGEYVFEYIPYSSSNNLKRGFFIVHEKGKVSLYSRPRVIFEESKKPAAYQDAQPARFIRKPDEYYIRIGMEPAKPVSGKKDLQAIFSGENKEIHAFLKTNKVKPGNLESLREIILFYNSL